MGLTSHACPEKGTLSVPGGSHTLSHELSSSQNPCSSSKGIQFVIGCGWAAQFGKLHRTGLFVDHNSRLLSHYHRHVPNAPPASKTRQ